ncbi:MAG TPA: hypothetical protein VG028_14450 [Terriglobia bacterium]|nr:hypothetical protein [Terriglobia bacterium]
MAEIHRRVVDFGQAHVAEGLPENMEGPLALATSRCWLAASERRWSSARPAFSLRHRRRGPMQYCQ